MEWIKSYSICTFKQTDRHTDRCAFCIPTCMGEIFFYIEIYTFHYTTFLRLLCLLTHFICEGLNQAVLLNSILIHLVEQPILRSSHHLEILFNFSRDVNMSTRTSLDGVDPAAVDADPGVDRREPEVNIRIRTQRYLRMVGLTKSHQSHTRVS